MYPNAIQKSEMAIFTDFVITAFGLALGLSFLSVADSQNLFRPLY